MASDAIRRATRGLIQLIASGGLTALIAVIANGLSTSAASALVAVGFFLTSWAQNIAEDAGWIPPILGTKESKTE